jgi:tetratricopeptide (TPR) repeat protein
VIALALFLLLADIDGPPKPPPLPADVEAALRAAADLEEKRSYDAARRQLGAVLDEVPAELAADLGLRLCNLWRLEDRLRDARDCYMRGSEQLPDHHARALARYHAGMLDLLGLDPDAGRGVLSDLVLSAPDSLGAHRALDALRAERHDMGGAGAEADFLLGIASRLEAAGPSRLLAEALVHAGRLRLVERGDAPGAERILARAERAAAGTVWLDDALIWRARALAASSRRDQALEVYRRIIESRQSSWFMGTYDSEFYDDALFEIGVTLEALGRLDAALRAYDAVAEEAGTSRCIDDAAFAAARLRAARGDRGALAQFIAAHAESRWVRAAKRLLELQ